MKVLKWIAIALGGLLAILLVAAVAIPYFFSDEIEALADEQIAAAVDADVAYGDIELSLLREFPRLSVAIADVTVDGRGDFEGVRLASIDEALAAVDFWSVIGDGPIGIEKVWLTRPELHVVVLPQGATNTDIVKGGEDTPTEVTTESGSTAIRLNTYGIEDGNVLYDDRAGDLYAVIRGLNHVGSGDFTATVFDLDTETSIEALTVTTGGVDYLYETAVDYDAELSVDTDAGECAFAKTSWSSMSSGHPSTGRWAYRMQTAIWPSTSCSTPPSKTFARSGVCYLRLSPKPWMACRPRGASRSRAP